MTALGNLPTELLDAICSFLDRNALKNFRQTCQSISHSATNELFKIVQLFPDEKGLESFGNILAEDRLLQRISMIYIHSSNYYDPPDLEQEVPDDFKAHIEHLKDLPSLHKVVLRLDKYRGYGMQYILIKHVFAALASIRPRDLKIRNMLMVNPADPTVRDNITKVLENLNGLHLKLFSHSDPYDTRGHNFFGTEPHVFLSEFPSTWLAPTASTLRRLALYSDMYFGFFPKLDLEGVHFPHLEILTLNKYTFFHDKQLDWILSHASTLTEIYLDDCPLIFQILVHVSHKHLCYLENTDWLPRCDDEPDDDWRHYCYSRDWSFYFDSFREKLPHLRHFRFGYDWMLRDRPPFEDATVLPLWSKAARMVGDFIDEDGNDHPCSDLYVDLTLHLRSVEGYEPPWDTWPNDTWSNLYRRWPREDKESLAALLEKIGQKEKLED